MDRVAGIIVFRSPLAAECRERSLVLKAMNIEHAVRSHADEWALIVPEHRVPVAVRQLDHYARESRNWPAGRPTSLPHHPLSPTGVVIGLAVLLAVAAAEGKVLFGRDWFEAGRVDTALVRQGEWWRAVTALTLHVDVGHLLGNLLLGGIFGLVAGRLLGNGLAWFGIVVAGVAGNAVSAVVQPPPHSAVGASTAVFAALGLIAAYVWRRRVELPLRWAARWAPIVVAAVLLAWTGSGNGRTDVVAHLTGFLAGIALGVAYGAIVPALKLGPRSQWVLGVGAVAIVAAAWSIALAKAG
ncbi:MAG: rhomboid family intramembrane serine protease [Phycisphaerales bacterium]|nr:rhomboid family intramembrane serine protease [Phycisphaerae bacterium]NNF44317.1 rhomboid family intramembrane serine protease [Phycisphaerales bacterium]NNM27246.1 rhomboid family intramembrane serine protease [Phycisphaerales bacterium]